MCAWQVYRHWGGLSCPTIEYVLAGSYAAAIDCFLAAMNSGASGFRDGTFDLAPVTSIPATFRGVPTITHGSKS